MGYELHITRTRDWLESAERPISREEWEAVARRHPAEQEDGVSHWSDIDSRPLFSITGSDGGEASLHWREAEVYVKGDYGDDFQRAILALAEELQAMLIGDESELYFADAYEHPDTRRARALPIPSIGSAVTSIQRTRWWRRANQNA